MAAPKKSKGAPAAAPAAAAPAVPTLDMGLLKQMVEATRNEAHPFMFYDLNTPALQMLVNAGYVETNPDVTDPPGSQNVAARATVAGMAFHDTAAAAPPPAPFGAGPAAFPAAAAPVATPAPTAPPAAVAPAVVQAAATGAAAGAVQGAASSAFALLANVPMPAPKRFGKASVYPFDSMALGQSFFVPATADRPNPAKSMASTVNSANARYATITGQDKDGNDIYGEPTRKFALRNIPDGAEAGFGTQYKGVKGAGVWRVK